MFQLNCSTSILDVMALDQVASKMLQPSTFVRRGLLIFSSISMICALSFWISQQPSDRSSLIVANVRQMQLEVMARRAAATGIRASQGYLPTVQYQSMPPMQNTNQYAAVQMYRPAPTMPLQVQPAPAASWQNLQQMPQQPQQSATGESPVDSELTDEAKGAHLALSGALSAFHGAALPQATVHSKNGVQAFAQNPPLSAFHDKLFRIFTAPESHGAGQTAEGNVKPSQALQRKGNSPVSRKADLQAFHDQMFQLMTSPEGVQKPAQQPGLSQQTVDNVISVDQPHVAAAKSRISAFHDHLFQLFTSPDDATQSVGQLKSDSAILSRDAERLKAVHIAAQLKANTASAASMADKGFYSLLHGGPAGSAHPAKPVQIDEGLLPVPPTVAPPSFQFVIIY
jgi:hypothetical protein